MNEKTRVKWSQVKAEVDKAFEFFDSQQVKPTLRTLYYRLVSVGVLPHTKAAYTTLSRRFVDWRKAGFYTWDALSDNTRITLGDTNDDCFDEGEIEELKANIEIQLDNISLGEILNQLFDHLTPYFHFERWALQPNIVEVWVEKEALSKTLEAWLSDKSIKIRVNRGYSSWTFIYNNVQELGGILANHDKIVILYLGDHDPSGLDIDRFLNMALDQFGIAPDQVEFRRFALTQDQINRYNLPPIEVNINDSRANGYLQIHGNRAWELDALFAYAPEEFKRELRETVDSYFDKSIYEKLNDRANELADEADEIIADAKDRAVEKIKASIKEALNP